jgi:hypothetical protein
VGLAPAPDGATAREGEAVTPIPAEPPIGGPFWSLAVPALLFLAALAATYLLYRHFAGKGTDF